MRLGDIIENFPSLLPRDPASVFKRYIEVHEDEVESFEQKLDEVIDSHQVDNATGDELDEIGKLFGRLGKRRGRTDQEYKIYLKTIVQAFKGRGTVPGIIAAVAAGLGTAESNVKVEEFYDTLEYDIILTDWPDHRGSTVEDLSELADASVSDLRRVTYDVGEDVALSDDAVSITEGIQIKDDTNAADTVSRTTTSVGWDVGNWDEMNWAKDR